MDSQHPIVNIDINADRHHGRDILRAVLHAVLFHRLMGIVKPYTFDVLDVTIPAIDNKEIETLVNSKADAIYRTIDLANNRRGQLMVTFAEKRAKKSWFSSAEEEVTWEQWLINVTAVQAPASSNGSAEFTRAQAAQLSQALRTILEHTSSERGRAAVPRITEVASGVSPFPYKISARVGGMEL